MSQQALTVTTSKQKLQGHVALLFANMFWGMMSPVTKSVLLGGDISPLALSALRIGGGALLFALCSLILPASVAPRERIHRSDYLKLLCASLLMISANQGLFILGIGYTNPIDSSVMSSLTPMITMLLAAWILHFPITRLKFLGVAIGLAGVIILVTDNSGNANATNPLIGDLLCFGAQICAALYYVLFGGLIKRYAPFTLMKWMFLIAAFTYVPCCWRALADVPYARVPAVIWMELGYIVVFATCLAYLTLPFAQKRLKPIVVSTYSYFQPVFAAIVAVWLGVGDFGAVKMAATLLIFAGVYFVSTNSISRSGK